MEFIDKIRQSIGNKLNDFKLVKPSQRKWTDLKSVNDIVLVSDVTSEDMEEATVNLRSELKQLCPNAKVLMLSYYDKKIRTDANNFVSNEGISEFITDDDFNYFYKMNSDSLKMYIKRDYDMAILLSKGEKKYISYVFQYIRAALRIGNKKTNDGKMNFVIDADNRMSAQEINREIIKYLKMFFE